MAKLGGGRHELAWILLGPFQGGCSKDLRGNMSHANPKRNPGERVVHVCVCVQYPYPPTAAHIHTYPTPTHPYPPLAAGGLAIHSFSSWEPFSLSTRKITDSILLSPGSSAIARHTINTQSAHSLTGSCSQHVCTSLKSHMGTVATPPGKAQATREFP